MGGSGSTNKIQILRDRAPGIPGGQDAKEWTGKVRAEEQVNRSENKGEQGTLFLGSRISLLTTKICLQKSGTTSDSL
jgi:hypothetical protein